jgi:hypothetical protein
MRAPILTFILVAASACTQGNTELPPYYDSGAGGTVDSSVADAADDVVTTGGDSATEAATDGGVGDGAVEAAGDGGKSGDGSTTDGPTDSGGGG